MPITFGTFGNRVAAAASAAPSYPAGTTAGQLMVFDIGVKPDTATVATPSGFTLVGTATGGTGVQGGGTGPVRVYRFVKELVGGETGTVTFTGANSPNIVIGQGFTLNKSAGETWNYSSFTNGSDATHGTSWSATGAANISLAAGDWLSVCSVGTANVGAATSKVVSATGSTFGTGNLRGGGGTGTNNDIHIATDDWPVNSGPSTAAPVHTKTDTLNNSGVTLFHRIRVTTPAAGISTLVDNFNDNAVASPPWSANYGSATETGGRARVPNSTTFAGYQSGNSYSFDQFKVQVPVVAALNGATTECYTAAWAVSDAQADGTDIGFFMDRITGNLKFMMRTAYDEVGAPTVTYDPVAHLWWQLRLSGGNLIWETSPNGYTWTTRRTATAPAYVSTAQDFRMLLECHRNAGTANFSEFDNVNVTNAPVSQDVDLRWRTATRVSQDVDLRWRAATRVNQDVDLRWIANQAITTTPVSSDLDVQWRTATRISQDFDARWRTSTVVFQDFDARWRTATRVSGDLDVRWRTATRVSGDLDARWLSRTTLTSDLDARWRTATRFSSDLDLRWRTSTTLTQDLDVRWRTNTRITQDLDARWRTSTRVSADADLRWVSTGQVSSDLDIRWTVIGKVAVDATLLWRTSTAVAADLDVRWRVLVPIQSDLDVRWRVRTGITADLDARWRTAVLVGADLDARWRTATRVSADADLRWIARTVALVDLDARWRTATRVTSDLDLRWLSRTTVTPATLDLRWISRTRTAGSDLDLRWRTASRVDGDLNLQWRVLTNSLQASNDLDARWRTRTLVSQDLDARWRTATSLASDLDLRWRGTSVIVTSLDLRWLVAQRIQADADLRWLVRTWVGASLDVRWREAVHAPPFDLELLWISEPSPLSPVPLPADAVIDLNGYTVVSLDPYVVQVSLDPVTVIADLSPLALP